MFFLSSFFLSRSASPLNDVLSQTIQISADDTYSISQSHHHVAQSN